MSEIMIQTAVEGSQGWIKISGPATMKGSPAFLNCLDEIGTTAITEIGVDFSECEWIDSTFAGCLIGYCRQAHQKNKQPLFVNRPSKRCLDSLRQLNLDKHMVIQQRAISPNIAWQTFEVEKNSGALTDVVIHAHEDLADSDPLNQPFKRIAEVLKDDQKKHLH